MENGLEQKLLAKNISPTAMRLLVLDYLVKQPHAASLAEIERELAPADRITIYRALKAFERNGLAHSITDGSSAQKFALCNDCSTDSHHDLHVHFGCSVCRETYCLPGVAIPKISLPHGFRTQEVQLTVKGVCDHCS